MMRPDGGSGEEMQAWNNRLMAEMIARMDRKCPAKPAQEATRLGDEQPTATTAVAAPEAEAMPFESVVQPGPGAEPAASASATPDPLPSQVPQPMAPDAPVRLPYPYNILNPADVPDEVWRQARVGQEKTL
jgi:hypothetical protein